MHFFQSGHVLRFFIEGYEMDIQDPSFFMDEEHYEDINETITEMLETYGKNISVVEQRESTLLYDNGQKSS
jgi:hypothetical protein